MPKPRMLVVDDEERIRFALSRWFKLCGFDVDIAEDGMAAVTKCREQDYDVVTMDLEMPRMNGTDAIAEIRRGHPWLPIIVLTGHPKNGCEADDYGADKVILKPASLSELEKEVRDAMAQRESAREEAATSSPDSRTANPA